MFSTELKFNKTNGSCKQSFSDLAFTFKNKPIFLKSLNQLCTVTPSTFNSLTAWLPARHFSEWTFDVIFLTKNYFVQMLHVNVFFSFSSKISLRINLVYRYITPVAFLKLKPLRESYTEPEWKTINTSGWDKNCYNTHDLIHLKV